MVHISLLILCHERLSLLKKSVDSLIKSDLPYSDISITFADDASSSPSVFDYLTEIKSSIPCPITVLRWEENLKPGLAHNKGISSIREEYNPKFLVITDSDIIYHKGWLQYLYVLYKSLDEVKLEDKVMISSHTFGRTYSRLIDSSFRCGIITGYNSIYHPYSLHLPVDSYRGLGVKATSGMCNWFLDINILQKIGLFKEYMPDWKFVDKLYESKLYVAATIPSIVQHIGHIGYNSNLELHKSVDYAPDFQESYSLDDRVIKDYEYLKSYDLHYIRSSATGSYELKKKLKLTSGFLFDGVFFQLFKTGIARVWASLLAEWAKTEFGQHIVILDRAQTAPQIPGLRYRTIPAFSYQNLEGDRQLLQQICDEENADLLISTYYTTPIATPTVFMGYDMIPEVMESLGTPVDLKEPMWAAKHHAINHARHYITISENTAQDLQQFFPDIKPEQVTVAHCGVSPDFSPPTAPEIAQFKHKYGITKPYFMTIGAGTGSYKNLILFYQAIAQLPTRQAFDIVATGVYLQVDPQFRDLAQGITIHTLNLSDAELRLAYGGAIALVYPSSYEGFGMPIAEAMACGCPVITCPNASIPEVAGEAALYVFDQDTDGMAEALCEVQKPTVRNSLIAAGLEQARQFSWATMAEIVANTLITTTLANLNLCDHNLIAFPDWTQPEDDLQASLTTALRQAVYYADALDEDSETLQITVLIDIDQAPELDLDALMTSAAMELMMGEELEIPDGIAVVPLPNLSSLQWQQLRSRLAARLVLGVENGDRIQTHCPNLPVLNTSET